jgi:hypothetical protein
LVLENGGDSWYVKAIGFERLIRGPIVVVSRVVSRGAVAGERDDP